MGSEPPIPPSLPLVGFWTIYVQWNPATTPPATTPPATTQIPHYANIQKARISFFIFVKQTSLLECTHYVFNLYYLHTHTRLVTLYVQLETLYS